MFSIRWKQTLLLAAVVLSLTAGAFAQRTAEDEFFRGYFLQTHEGDLAGAVSAFERVVGDAGAPEALRAQAKQRLAECREDLGAADLARLMPPDAVAYFEVTKPGAHVGRLATMLGLVRSVETPPAGKEAQVTPLGNGIFFPDDFTISPTLVSALNGFKGLAVAVTRFDPRGDAAGVLVLHPGDSDLIRGLIETAVQMLEPAEGIEGFKTYRVHGQAWVTVTRRLIIVARTRDELESAVSRLKNPAAESLAGQAGFSSLQADRENALLFAYVSGPQVMKHLGPALGGHEALIAKSVLDLDHLAAISASLQTTDGGIELQARVDLMEGHRNLAYGLIRTAPCSRRSLAHVPSGVAAVALLGLNLPSDGTVGEEKGSAKPVYLTAMDLGREIFANMEEVSVFVMGADKGKKAGGPIPDFGMVIAAKDAGKSEALWTQLLSLPAMVGAPGVSAPVATTIEGRSATAYQFPHVPPIVLVRLGEGVITAGTQGAVAASLRASADGEAIAGDSTFTPLLDSLTPASSKAILVHVGRTLPLFGGLADGDEAQYLMIASSLLKELTVSLVTHEAPTQFVVSGQATGLPNVPEVIKTFAGHRHASRHRGNVDAAEPVADAGR